MPRSRANKGNYLEEDEMTFSGLQEESSRWIPRSSAELEIADVDSTIEGKRLRENNFNNFDQGRLNYSSDKWKDDMFEEMRTKLRAKYEINSDSSPSMENKRIKQASYIKDEISMTRKEDRKDTQHALTPKTDKYSSKDDFFGIAEEANRASKLDAYEDGKSRWLGSPVSLSKDEIFAKYLEPYIGKQPKSSEKMVKSQYGFLRMDEDNTIKTRENKKSKKISSDFSSEQNVSRAAQDTEVLAEINDNIPANSAAESVEDKAINQNFTSTKDITGSSGSDFIESQYFSYGNVVDSKNADDKNVSDENMTGVSYIENQYFGGNATEATAPSLDEIAKQYSNVSFPKVKSENTSAAARKQAELHENSSVEESEKNGLRTRSKSHEELKVHESPEYRPRDASYISGNTFGKLVKEIRRENIQMGETRKLETEISQDISSKQSEIHENISEQARRKREAPKPNLEEPETAYDMAMKIRQAAKGRDQPAEKRTMAHEKLKNWKGKLDSRGFRILKDQVPNLEYLPQEVVVNILKDSIIFQNDDIIAIDKPYGLPSHGGPGVHHSVGGLLKELASKMKEQKEPLHLIHRLDKETTGVMLLARNAEIAWKVHGMFKRREISKTYWALTKGVPNPQAGIIDIPMAEDEVKGRYRMGLRPRRDENTKLLQSKAKPGTKFQAVTEYKVLSYIASAALVQCTPLTGIKHQIRCHLAFGLNTPILGDHKYSHLSDIKPQKLHPEILDKLKIRQPTARYLATHLHARELVLPEFYEGRNTIIRARLPDYFVRNMKWLKLAIPK